VAGLAGALAAPALAAGGGLGIFGAVTIGAIAKAKKDAKEIADLRKKATAATNPADAAKFAKQANELEKSLSKSERAFLKAKDAIGGAFDTLLARTGPNVFGVLAAGATLLSKVMPKVAPIVNAFGGAIRGMIGDLSKWTDTASFKGFVDFLAKNGASAFKTFTDITKNLAVGIGGIVKAFAPSGTSLLGFIDGLSKKFANFGQNAGSNGFQKFLTYVQDVGPKVWQTLLDLGGAVGKVVAALAPQGSTMLGVIDALAHTVAKMKPGQIAAVAGAVGALGLATGKFGKLTSLGLLVTAISYAYKHSDAFRSLADGAARFADAINSLPSGVKTGLSAKDYGRKLSSLPKGVQTKVTTPGAINSKADVQRLKRQFDLTPRRSAR
jgi:hypothetical protein